MKKLFMLVLLATTMGLSAEELLVKNFNGKSIRCDFGFRSETFDIKLSDSEAKLVFSVMKDCNFRNVQISVSPDLSLQEACELVRSTADLSDNGYLLRRTNWKSSDPLTIIEMETETSFGLKKELLWKR